MLGVHCVYYYAVGTERDIQQYVDSDPATQKVLYRYFRGIPLDFLFDYASRNRIPEEIQKIVDQASDRYFDIKPKGFEIKLFNLALDIDTLRIVVIDQR